MAALLCQAFGNLCNDCCSLVTLPCRACCELACSPFVPYIAVTLLLNVPLVVYGIQPFTENAATCDKVWWLYANAIMAAFHIIAAFYISNSIQHEKHDDDNRFSQYHGGKHYNDMESNAPVMATAAVVPPNTAVTGLDNTKSKSPSSTGNPFLDLYNKVSASTQSKDGTIVTATPQQQYETPTKVEPITTTHYVRPDDTPDSGPAMSYQRLSRVLCYDPIVAIYILVVIAWVAWQTIGITTLISLAGANDGDDCGQIKKWIVMSTMCGWIYMMVVFCAFGCSLLCLR